MCVRIYACVTACQSFFVRGTFLALRGPARGQPDPFHSVRKSSFSFPDGRPRAGHKPFILFGFLHPPWPSSRQTWLSPFGKEIIVFLTRRPPQGWARKGKNKKNLWAGVRFFFCLSSPCVAQPAAGLAQPIW